MPPNIYNADTGRFRWLYKYEDGTGYAASWFQMLGPGMGWYAICLKYRGFISLN